MYNHLHSFQETRLEKARSESMCESLQQKVDLAEDKAFQLMDKLEVYLIRRDKSSVTYKHIFSIVA